MDTARILERTQVISGGIRDPASISGSLTMAERENIQDGGIRDPASISGSLTMAERENIQDYEGQTVVVPKAYLDQELGTGNRRVRENIKVLKIPYYETSNEKSGYTVCIAPEE